MCEMVLAELGLDYKCIDIDLFKEQQKSADFLKINLSGWIPALVLPGGQVLYETAAINLYLAETYSDCGLAPPTGSADRAQFLCFLFAISNDIESEMKRYFYPHRYNSLPKNREAEASIKQRALNVLAERFQPFEERLAQGQTSLLGEQFTIAELC